MRFYDILLWFLIFNVSISTVGVYAIEEANIFNLDDAEKASLLEDLPIGNIHFVDVFETGVMGMMSAEGIGDFVIQLLTFGSGIFVSFGNLCISCVTGIPQMMYALEIPELAIVLINFPLYLTLFVGLLQLISNRSLKYLE